MAQRLKEIWSGKRRVIKKEKVLDSWSVLIGNAQGKAEEVYDTTIKFVEATNAPSVKLQPAIIETGRTSRGKRIERDYLMVTNEEMKDYRMYVGVRDYGIDLNVSWYLTVEPGFIKRFFSTVFERNPYALSFHLDIFQLEELSAYVTSTHHCVLKAVEDVMNSLGQNPSKIDRKSRGFLGVS